MKNTDSENVRKFVGLLLALAKGNKPVQDLLVKVRRCRVTLSNPRRKRLELSART